MIFIDESKLQNVQFVENVILTEERATPNSEKEFQHDKFIIPDIENDFSNENIDSISNSEVRS